MSICIYTVYTLVALVSVLGQVEVHTAAQLADALRDGQRSIHIGSTITGYEDEQQAFTAGELTSERYSDFPQVRWSGPSSDANSCCACRLQRYGRRPCFRQFIHQCSMTAAPIPGSKAPVVEFGAPQYPSIDSFLPIVPTSRLVPAQCSYHICADLDCSHSEGRQR